MRVLHAHLLDEETGRACGERIRLRRDGRLEEPARVGPNAQLMAVDPATRTIVASSEDSSAPTVGPSRGKPDSLRTGSLPPTASPAGG